VNPHRPRSIPRDARERRMHAPRLLRGVLSSRQRGVKLHPVIGIVLVVITYALFHYCAEINWQRAAIRKARFRSRPTRMAARAFVSRVSRGSLRKDRKDRFSFRWILAGSPRSIAEMKIANGRSTLAFHGGTCRYSRARAPQVRSISDFTRDTESARSILIDRNRS
jgi:hypothetical protein